MSRPFSFLLVILLVPLALLTRVSSLQQAVQRNQLADQSLIFCQAAASGIAAAQPGFSQIEDELYFAAILAHCQGDLEAEQTTWSSYLTLTNLRLVVIRALQPENLDLAKQAALAYPGDFTASFWYAELLEKAGEDQAALQVYQQAAEARPLFGLVYYRIGTLYEKMGDRQAALQAYDRACGLGDQGKNGCVHAGRLYLVLGQYELAEKSFRTSLVQLHNFPTSIIGLARALLGQGRTAEAIQVLQPLADSGNTDAEELLASLAPTPPSP